MVTENLDKIFHPKNIAIIGASDEEGSVGYRLMKNLTELDFKGTVYPVNLHKSKIWGIPAYKTVNQLTETIDLAVIATPAKTVPEIVEQCGKAGVKGIIIISAGFKEIGPQGKLLEEKILALKKKYNLRIIGPNCLGVIRPSIQFNSTFATKMPKSGNISFLSQSGALGTSILDWAIHEGIGFSNFVSVGSMIDVDFGDLIDYFGMDPETKSILMYIEGLTDARKFMSAARHFARTKPIIILKAGKYSESAEAAASHTGSLTGEDMIYNAAFKRAGIVRVEEIGELFNCAAVLGMQPLPKGSNLAIITNAGGPGVMSTDTLISRGGTLALLSKETKEKLNNVLPTYWSRRNPIDILGDAKDDRYTTVVEACLKDNTVEGILVIYTPQGVVDPVKIAESIVNLYKKTRSQKTIVTSFMGYEEVEKANHIFTENSIPTYSTPEQAVKTFLYMYQYKRNLNLLYETPEELPVDSVPPKRPLNMILRKAAEENRDTLTEKESKQFLSYYNIPVIKTLVAKTVDEAVIAASHLEYPVAMKILSHQITHKTDAGGVILDIASERKLRDAFEAIMKNAQASAPNALIQGVTIQPMIKKQGCEIILGAKTDPLFGPVILFGMGGVGVELFKDVSIGLPPVNQIIVRRIMENTKAYKLLQGYRNIPPANMKLLEEVIVRFSQILVDFPQIQEVDINPLFIDEKKVFALDARIVIDKEKVFKKYEAYEHLVVSPYPKKYESYWNLRDGRTVLLRPIKPEDEPLWLEMFQNFSEQSIRYRFFEIIKETPHEVRIRYCNIDYDREIAIVAELIEKEKRKILGVARLIVEPNLKTGEIAFIVADPWQGIGLGSKMIDYMIDICKDKRLESIYGLLLQENQRAINLMKEMGFSIKRLDEDTVEATLNLTE